MFVEFSCRFRGVFREIVVRFSRLLQSKHLLTLGEFSWVFRGVFVDPQREKISGIIGGFSWPFRGCPCHASGRRYARADCLGKH